MWHFFGLVRARRKVASSRAIAVASSGAALPGFDLPQRTQQACADCFFAETTKQNLSRAGLADEYVKRTPATFLNIASF